MSEVEIITAVVLTHLTGGVGKIVAAPLSAAASELEERVRSRLHRIGSIAQDKADGQPLEVSDRVLFKALVEGGYADDEIVADYLGGVLAASSGDDAGAAIVALIGRLSALQLRLHYVIYRELRRLWPVAAMNLYEGDEAAKAGIEIGVPELMQAVGKDDADSIGSSLAVLNRERLITDYSLSRKEKDGHAKWTTTATPTGLGAEFFLWGHGVRGVQAHLLFDRGLDLHFLSEVPPTPGAVLMTPPASKGPPPA